MSTDPLSCPLTMKVQVTQVSGGPVVSPGPSPGPACEIMARFAILVSVKTTFRAQT